MVEDEGKKDEPKVEFDSAGQAIADISLDQARVLALQHARDNRHHLRDGDTGERSG